MQWFHFKSGLSVDVNGRENVKQPNEGEDGVLFDELFPDLFLSQVMVREMSVRHAFRLV